MKMEQTECSETSAYNNQTARKYPKECIQDSKHGESLKSTMFTCPQLTAIFLAHSILYALCSETPPLTNLASNKRYQIFLSLRNPQVTNNKTVRPSACLHCIREVLCLTLNPYVVGSPEECLQACVGTVLRALNPYHTNVENRVSS